MNDEKPPAEAMRDWPSFRWAWLALGIPICAVAGLYVYLLIALLGGGGFDIDRDLTAAEQVAAEAAPFAGIVICIAGILFCLRQFIRACIKNSSCAHKGNQ